MFVFWLPFLIVEANRDEDKEAEEEEDVFLYSCVRPCY
jgi:hypothetical protein